MMERRDRIRIKKFKHHGPTVVLKPTLADDELRRWTPALQSVKGPALWSVVREIEIETKPSHTHRSHIVRSILIEHQQVRPRAVAFQPCPPHLDPSTAWRRSAVAGLDVPPASTATATVTATSASPA